MNMPPPPYLRRLPGLPAELPAGCYTDPTVWHSFDPATLSLCSPDPQALRPAGGPPNVAEGDAADQLQGRALRLG